MRRYPAMPTSRPREHAALTSQYLEALPEDQMEGEMDYAATGRVRADLLRTSQADEQAEVGSSVCQFDSCLPYKIGLPR